MIRSLALDLPIWCWSLFFILLSICLRVVGRYLKFKSFRVSSNQSVFTALLFIRERHRSWGSYLWVFFLSWCLEGGRLVHLLFLRLFFSIWKMFCSHCLYRGVRFCNILLLLHLFSSKSLKSFVVAFLNINLKRRHKLFRRVWINSLGITLFSLIFIKRWLRISGFNIIIYCGNTTCIWEIRN